MKRCSRCDERKELEAFNKDSSKSDGRYPVCKTCRKPVSKSYYSDNRAEIRTKAKAAYTAAPEKHREASKQYRLAHPEYMRQYAAKYYQDNKERWLEYAKNQDPEAVRKRRAIYVAANREAIRAGVRDWFRRNPHAARLNGAAYRMRLKSVPNTLTADEIDETLEVFNHCCGYCLTDLEALPPLHRTLDHMDPISRGGGNTQVNVIPACKTCNSRKKDRPILFMARYL